MVHDLWIIGDSFGKDNFGELEAMKFEAIKRAKEPEKERKSIPIMQPYITDFFNVLEYENVDVNQEEFAAIRMLNALAQAIIKRRCLPKILIVMADLDLI